MSYIRLYLVSTTPTSDQQILDVDSLDLVLSNGKFLPVQTAPSVTLVLTPIDFDYTAIDDSTLDLSNQQTQEIKVCWREPVDSEEYPSDTVVIEPDPTDGMCVCGITCQGTKIAYAQVLATAPA